MDQTALPGGWPSVVHMLVDAARQSPRAPALVCGEDRLDYGQYAACVAGLAGELGDLGIGGGHRVALVMGNSADIAIAIFAVQASGAQVVPLNPAYTAAELEPMLADAQCSAIIHDSAVAALVAPLADRLGVPHRLDVGRRRLTRWRDDAALARAFIETLALPTGDQLSTLQYTGGTTGRSKGVDLIHRAIAVNVGQREALLPTTPLDERVLAITPLFHVYAVAMGLYLAAHCRGTLVILERYRPDTVLQAIATERITLLSASPTILTGLLEFDGFAAADLSSLRLCVSGASALPAEVLQRWEAATGCMICEGYGQTESGPVLSFNPRAGERKPASVGIVVPGTVVELVDLVTGETLHEAGRVGEIRARGPQLMTGYRGLPDETAKALREGWLYTGDVGEFDGDAYLYIRGRSKEMAIISGFNVYPREVEDALLSHPQVTEAGVVGVPDAYRGEILAAFICVRGAPVTAEEILFHLAGRLARYKIPSRIGFLQTLPKTSVGKPDKQRLRDLSLMLPEAPRLPAARSAPTEEK